LRRNKEYVDLYIHPPYGFMVLWEIWTFLS
jgi:hypothetical protein